MSEHGKDFWDRWEGRTVEVTDYFGIIDAQAADGSAPFIMLFESDAPDANCPLGCNFARADAPAFRALRMNEKVTIRGTCSRMTRGYPKLTGCAVAAAR